MAVRDSRGIRVPMAGVFPQIPMSCDDEKRDIMSDAVSNRVILDKLFHIIEPPLPCLENRNWQFKGWV